MQGVFLELLADLGEGVGYGAGCNGQVLAGFQADLSGAGDFLQDPVSFLVDFSRWASIVVARGTSGVGKCTGAPHLRHETSNSSPSRSESGLELSTCPEPSRIVLWK